jgi:phage portal protein BeeE
MGRPETGRGRTILYEAEWDDKGKIGGERGKWKDGRKERSRTVLNFSFVYACIRDLHGDGNRGNTSVMGTKM